MLLDHFTRIVVFIHEHFACFNLGDFGVGDPLDMAVTKFAFQQALGVTHTAETKMTNIGFTGDERHGDLVPNAFASQRGIQNGSVFICRAETTCALDCTDNDVTGIFDQTLEIFIGLFSMIYRADGLGKTINRACPRNFIERQLGSGGDEEIIVLDGFAVFQNEAVAFRFQFIHELGNEIDALLF